MLGKSDGFFAWTPCVIIRDLEKKNPFCLLAIVFACCAAIVVFSWRFKFYNNLMLISHISLKLHLETLRFDPKGVETLYIGI